VLGLLIASHYSYADGLDTTDAHRKHASELPLVLSHPQRM